MIRPEVPRMRASAGRTVVSLLPREQKVDHVLPAARAERVVAVDYLVAEPADAVRRFSVSARVVVVVQRLLRDHLHQPRAEGRRGNAEDDVVARDLPREVVLHGVAAARIAAAVDAAANREQRMHAAVATAV